MSKIYSVYTTSSVEYSTAFDCHMCAVNYTEGFNPQQQLPGNLVDIACDTDFLKYVDLSYDSRFAIDSIRAMNDLDFTTKFKMVFTILVKIALRQRKTYVEMPDGGCVAIIMNPDRADQVAHDEIAESMKKYFN